MVQALARALNILTILGEAGAPLSLSAIARLADLSPSTTHRLLTTLQQERYVRFEPATRRWSVGVQAFVTGNGFLRTRNLVDYARPRMRRLMEQAGERVNLAVEENGLAVYLAQVECRPTMRAPAPPGVRTPLHCSAVGKALLAAMPERQRSAILAGAPLRRFTPATLVTRQALEEQLVRVRDSGYSVANEEQALGLRCVASVIYDEAGQPMAALSLSGPKVRIGDDRVDFLGVAVRATALAITADLGGSVTGP